MSGTWAFDGYIYIEHLAVDGSLRSQGYGKRLLGQILERASKTILEIDPLTTAIAHKRLRFYEGMGSLLTRGRTRTRPITPVSPITN